MNERWIQSWTMRLHWLWNGLFSGSDRLRTTCALAVWSATWLVARYTQAQEICKRSLAPTHPLRLGLALNFAVRSRQVGTPTTVLTWRWPAVAFLLPGVLFRHVQESRACYFVSGRLTRARRDAIAPCIDLIGGCCVCHASIAKTAFDGAVADLNTLDEATYRDATLILQLIRDNITLWTSAMADSGDES